MIKQDVREALYNDLVSNKHFLYLFDLLQLTHKQSYDYLEKTKEEPDEIFRIEDTIREYIMEECNLYIDEYDLFLAKNNLTYDSPSAIIEKIKKEQGFNGEYCSREVYEDLLSDYSSGNSEYTKEQIIKQLIFWEQNIILDDIEFIDFHYKEPRYKRVDFRKEQ